MKFGSDWPSGLGEELRCLNIVDGQKTGDDGWTSEHGYTMSLPDEPAAKVS